MEGREERISELVDKITEITQSEQQRKRLKKRGQGLRDCGDIKII